MPAYIHGGMPSQASKSWSTSPARLHYATTNRKLAPVGLEVNTTDRLRPVARGPYCSATYVSIEATCPDTCRFKGGACYVTAGFTGGMMKALDSAAESERVDADEVIVEEAMHIEAAFPANDHQVPQDGARGGRDLRLHIGGDVGSTFGALRLDVAARIWRSRGGGRVWTFTHRWRDIPRRAWGVISVLASVETALEAEHARVLGYVPALVVQRFETSKAFRVAGSSTRFIPCPAETKGTTCVECRLCLDAEKLRERDMGIAFAVHGRQSGKVALPVVGGES